VEDYPRDLTEFEARFSTEIACRDCLARLQCAGWLSVSPIRCAEDLASPWGPAAMCQL